MSPEDFLQAVRAWHTTYRRAASALAPHNVTPMQWALMVAVENHPGFEMSELADLLRISLPKISTDAELLYKDGLVKRKRVVGDRRKRQLALTLAGRRLLYRAHDAMAKLPMEDHYEHEIDTKSLPSWCEQCDTAVTIISQD